MVIGIYTIHSFSSVQLPDKKNDKNCDNPPVISKVLEKHYFSEDHIDIPIIFMQCKRIFPTKISENLFYYIDFLEKNHFVKV